MSQYFCISIKNLPCPSDGLAVAEKTVQARFVAGSLGSTFKAVQSYVLFCLLTFIVGAVEGNYLTVLVIGNVPGSK